MRNAEREWMKRAIGQAQQAKTEGGNPRPKVGAVIVRDDLLVGEAFRGELGEGQHAEFTLLQKKLEGKDLAGCTLYTTLEPCTTRNPPKLPCTTHILQRGITHVVIGMVDPNETIRGNGIWALRQAGVAIEFFEPDLMKVNEDLNREFIKPHLASGLLFRPPHFLKPSQRKLDDWYHSINAIYADKNYYRDAASLFSHLVEIMNGLSLLATSKTKPGVRPESYIPKALAWWLALCGKVGIRSVEDMLWAKFPGVCPYCRERPHRQKKCQEDKAKNKNPDWVGLGSIGMANAATRPRSLGQWQRMFNEIYEAQQTEDFQTIFGRFTEELGELAEAVRVIDAVPEYFISEAADVFAWLMHLANLIDVKTGVSILQKEEMQAGNPMNQDAEPLEIALYREYPDYCNECRRPVCTCPPVLPRTLGRLAHEGPADGEKMFVGTSQMRRWFEAGATSLSIDDVRFDVTAALIAELYHGLTEVRDELKTKLNLQLPVAQPLLDSIDAVIALAVVQRINQQRIDNLLRLVLHLDKKEISRICEIIRRSPQTAFQDALISFLDR